MARARFSIAAVRHAAMLVLGWAAAAAMVCGCKGPEPKLALPPPAIFPLPKPVPMTITISAAGQFVVQGRTVAGTESLRGDLREHAAALKGRERFFVTLKVCPGVDYEQVALVMQACGQAGIEEAWRSVWMQPPDSAYERVLPPLVGAGNGPARFFGILAGAGLKAGAAAPAGKIVYVIDASGSMTDSLDIAKFELKRSIGDLPWNQDFHVIFFAWGPPQEMPPPRQGFPLEGKKEAAFRFIDGIAPGWDARPSEALERAFACGPDVIYFLTDGEVDRNILDLLKRLNPRRRVTVHVICLLNRPEGEVLKEIATENGGQYKLVLEEDLEKLGKE